MPTQRRLRFIYAQTAAMAGSLIVLVLLDALTLELFFVLSLIGLLVNTELTAPFTISPPWRRRLRWVILCGLIGFGYIVLQRILTILSNS